MKRAAILFLTVVITLTLASCREDRSTIKVKSVDYPELSVLTAEEPDLDRIKYWYFGTNPYLMNSCYLKLSDDNELIIYNDEPHYKPHIYCGDSCYFVGVNLSHYDGWVKMYPYNHLHIQSEEYKSLVDDPPKAEVKVVAPENCVGFIGIDNKNAYLITQDLFSIEVTPDGKDIQSKIYKLHLESIDDEWEWEVIGTMEHNCTSFVYDKESNGIYLVSETEIAYFDLETCQYTVLADISAWRAVNSMVKLENKLYLGMDMGIYEYDIESGESLWYPIPHEKYGTEEEKAQYDEHVRRIETNTIALYIPETTESEESTNEQE